MRKLKDSDVEGSTPLFGQVIFISLNLDTKLFAFGDNQFGQLGLGNNTSQNSPKEVKFFNKLKINNISCGMDHTLVWAGILFI
jgi:alpha-tubulin suppressor-like RCC1 family protein